jgi:hypothetical protein
MRKISMALWALLLTTLLQAQDNQLQTDRSSRLSDSLWSIYQAERGENLAIYRGRQILGGYPGIGGSAYFPFTDWASGSAQYEGVWYHNLELLYDIYRDEVLIRHPSGIPFVLYNNRLQAFRIMGRDFVHFIEPRGDMSPGIYEVLHKGKLTIYARRSVMLDEKIIDQAVERNFISKFRYYAQTGDKVKQFTKQKQLMELVRDQRNQIQPRIREAGVKYKHNPEAIIKIIAETYNQL